MRYDDNCMLDASQDCVDTRRLCQEVVLVRLRQVDWKCNDGGCARAILNEAEDGQFAVVLLFAFG